MWTVEGAGFPTLCDEIWLSSFHVTVDVLDSGISPDDLRYTRQSTTDLYLYLSTFLNNTLFIVNIVHVFLLASDTIDYKCLELFENYNFTNNFFKQYAAM